MGLATESLAAAREIEGAYSRALVLHSIAEALGKAGLAMEAREAAVEAREAAIEALADAREERSVYFRARDLSSIAADLMKAGMITEAREAAMEARETAKKAFAAAREIEKTEHRARCFITFAEALVAAGMATDALDAAREIEEAEYRSMVFHLVASEMVEAGMVMEALAIAREIEDVSRGATVLMKVTDFWLERRQDDDVRNLLEETQSAVSKVFADEGRSWLMRDLAVILARLHSYCAAREAAEQCSISPDRLAAYTAILREYHIERDPSLARLFAAEKEEEEDD